MASFSKEWSPSAQATIERRIESRRKVCRVTPILQDDGRSGEQEFFVVDVDVDAQPRTHEDRARDTQQFEVFELDSAYKYTHIIRQGQQ